jgi:hypothetical protein
MALEKELKTYKGNLEQLTAQQGRFVLIHDSQVIDTFKTYEGAIKEGYTKFGLNQPFLVKQIFVLEPVYSL